MKYKDIFQKLFEKYEIKEGRIVAYDYAIFDDIEIVEILEKFILSYPKVRIPFKEININKKISFLKDLDIISTQIDVNLKKIKPEIKLK